MKTCKTCGLEKPLEDFHLHKGGKGGRRASCITCRRPQNATEARKRTPEHNRKSYIKYMYGITPEQYDKMLTDQNDCCASCGIHKDEFDKRLHIDHDHKCCPGKRSCGKCIRGIICIRCNAALGYVRDSKEILQMLVEYLDRTENA